MGNKLKRLNILFLLLCLNSFAQVKISGVVVDSQNQSVPFANIVFTGSTVGTVSDENGKFYLESDKTYTEIEVSFLGFETAKILIKSCGLYLGSLIHWVCSIFGGMSSDINQCVV